MKMSSNISDRKKQLLAYKEKVLRDIQYYENRIKEARSAAEKTNFVEMEGSDSDTECSIQVKSGPSISGLKEDQSMLQTCLQATQELAGLEVISSNVNIMVEDPVFVCEPAVTEAGTWYSVEAECCVDLVPFSISFYAHWPDRKFASTCYRGLRLAPSKPAHAVELAASVLPEIKLPSEAVQVVRNYASAHRSRRATLARLAEQFGDALFMAPLVEGGYMLKVAGLLEVSWGLQNKWSHANIFYNRMTWDLEYMDESYLKVITHAHRQLSNLDLDTQERTLLIARIISTCLEAQGPTQELYESLSSDPDTASKLRRRRTTLALEPEAPVNKKSKKDSQVMAPPKTVPKKTKPKGKENTIDKRKSASEVMGTTSKDLDNAKKARASDIAQETSSRVNEKSTNVHKKCNMTDEKTIERKNSVASLKNNYGTTNENVAASKNDVATSKHNINDVLDGKQIGDSDKMAQKDKLLASSTKTDSAGNAKKSANAVKRKITKSNEDGREESDAKIDGKTAEKISEKIKSVTSVKNGAGRTKNIGDDDGIKVVPKPKKNDGTNVNSGKLVKKNKNKLVVTEKNSNSGKLVEKNKITPNSEGNVINKEIATKVVKKTQNVKDTDKIASRKNDDNIRRVASIDNPAELKTIEKSKSVANLKKKDNLNEAKSSKNKDTEKNVASENIDPKTASNEEVTSKLTKKHFNKPRENTTKPNNNLVNINKVKPDNIKKKNTLISLNKPKITSEVNHTGNTNKKIVAGNIEKENGDKNKAVSKIPQKKLTSTIHSNAFKNFPLRVSPRNPISKLKVSPRVGSSVKPRSIQKPITNIPRLMAKTKPNIFDLNK